MVMYGYVVTAAERDRSRAERAEADGQLGAAAAAVGRGFGRFGRLARGAGLRRRGPAAGMSTAPAVR